jgi:hypothetical protein
VNTPPESPTELLEELFTIFPQYRANYHPIHDDTPTYHSVMLAFTPFFGAQLASISTVQFRKFGALVSEAVTQEGPLENAFGTCFLEHLHQIKAEHALRPYLSDLARNKTRA